MLLFSLTYIKRITIMPQIDKVAYFAQVLWVFGLFVAFYAIISVEVLSGISTVYSVRKHIKSQCTKYGSELSQENVDMEFNYNSLIKHSCAESKKVLNKSVLEIGRASCRERV